MDPVTLTERDALTALLKALEAVVSARLAVVVLLSVPLAVVRAKRLKLAVKLGDGTLRFSHAAVMKFIEKNRA